MTKPAVGVKPMLVSMLLPSCTAARLAPLPRCARITRPVGRPCPQDGASSSTDTRRIDRGTRTVERLRVVAPGMGSSWRPAASCGERPCRSRPPEAIADAAAKRLDYAVMIVPVVPQERAHRGRRRRYLHRALGGRRRDRLVQCQPHVGTGRHALLRRRRPRLRKRRRETAEFSEARRAASKNMSAAGLPARPSRRRSMPCDANIKELR